MRGNTIEDEASLDWTDKDFELLCQHVLEHGEQNLALIAAVLKCPVQLLTLKWNVLRVRVQKQTADHMKRKDPKWSPWELDVLLRGINAFPGFHMARLYKVLESWLPGRTHYAVKQALKTHIAPCLGARLAAAVSNQLPETVTGVLMRWHSGMLQPQQTDVKLSAQQVASYILHQAPELLTNSPLPKASGLEKKKAGIKRDRTTATMEKESTMPHDNTEQVYASMAEAGFRGGFTAVLGAGAAAAGGTSEGVWATLSNYSPALSSSSSSSSNMVWRGMSIPGSAALPCQSAATIPQMAPITFSTPLKLITKVPKHDVCSNLSADGPDSNMSVTPAMAAGGLNALFMLNSMLQQQSQACVMQQQQLNRSEQPGRPTKRQRSRLSQSAFKSMQHAVAAAAATRPALVP